MKLDPVQELIRLIAVLICDSKIPPIGVRLRFLESGIYVNAASQPLWLLWVYMWFVFGA